MSDHDDACIWDLSETPCKDCIDRIQWCADQDDSNFPTEEAA